MYNERFAGALPIYGRFPATPHPDPGLPRAGAPPAPPGKASSHVRHALRELRANLRYRIGQTAARLIGPRAYSDRLIRDEISSVLICRINARMGNAVFLTPLIHRIHELLPHASVDLAIAYPKADDLLGSLPGVRRIILFPYKGVRLVWRYLAAVRRVRRERFDLVIDPAPNSTSGRMVLMLARARYRLGFATDDQWSPLTHAIPFPDTSMHQAAQPEFLLSRALGLDCDPRDVRLWLPLEPQEIEAGRAAIARAVAAKGRAGTAEAFGFFAHATGLKAVAPAYWRAFLDAFLELQPDAIPVEVLPSPASVPTDPRCASLHLPSPRALTAAMSAMRLFVSADTGPMHLAGSTAVPTIALFRASDPALYGPMKPCDLSLDVARCSPRAVADRCQSIWQQHRRGGV